MHAATDYNHADTWQSRLSSPCYLQLVHKNGARMKSDFTDAAKLLKVHVICTMEKVLKLSQCEYCSSQVESSCYLLLVRLILEYACVIWSPYYQYKYTYVIEMVQRCVARYVCHE